MAIVNLKKEGVITKLWRKWVLSTKQTDCEAVSDEVNNNKSRLNMFTLNFDDLFYSYSFKTA